MNARLKEIADSIEPCEPFHTLSQDQDMAKEMRELKDAIKKALLILAEEHKAVLK